MTTIEAITYEVNNKQKKVRKAVNRVVLGDYVSHCITPTAPQGKVEEAMKGWKVTWEFSNNHVWHQTFLTEAEALAFVERSIDNDPNVLSWVIIEALTEEV